jgi:hypothetical protein
VVGLTVTVWGTSMPQCTLTHGESPWRGSPMPRISRRRTVGEGVVPAA